MPRKAIVPTDGPWSASTPEDGDGDDTVVICNDDASHYEVITIHAGSLAKRKSLGNRIAELLNQAKATLE